MPFFSGVARALGNTLATTRQENMRQAEAQADRENRVLQTLAQSEDPEIAAHGIAGLMDQTLNRPQKGLRGWLGQMEGNPALPRIRDLVAKGRQQIPQAAPLTFGGEDTGGGPGGPSAGAGAADGAGAAASPPPRGSAALPASSPTEGGGMSMQAIEAAPPGGVTPGAQGRTQPMPGAMQNVPRSLGISAAEHAGATAEAEKYGGLRGTIRALGDESGTGAGLDPTTREYAVGHALGLPNSRSTDVQGNENFFIGNRQVGTAQGVAKPSEPVMNEQQQVRQYQAAHPEVSDADALTAVRSTAARVTANKATTAGLNVQSLRQRIVNEQATGTGTLLSNEQKQRALNGQLTASEAASTVSRMLTGRPDATTDMYNEWVGALTAGVGGQPQAATPPPAANTAAQGGQPAAVTPPPATAQPAITRPTPNAPPRPAPVQPAAPGAASAPVAGLPTGQSLYKPNASEQSTLDTITAATPMMQRVRDLLKGHEQDNSWGSTAHAVGQAAEAMVGHNPSDPIYQALDPLIQHLKVFALGPYLHGIRNGAFVKSVSDNTPSVTDTPARIIAKLDNLEQNFRDIAAAVGANKAGAGGAATAGPPGAVGPATTQKPIPGIPGGLAESADGGKTWRRVK